MELADVSLEVPAQTCLSTWWLGEPECPLVHERVLDVEVVLIVEDGDLLILSTGRGLLVLVAVGAFWRNGDGGQVDGCRSINGCLWGDCCHDCGLYGRMLLNMIIDEVEGLFEEGW